MIVLLMGVSGCGKSTIARRLAAIEGWTVLEGDTFHPPANVAKMAAGIPLTDEDRWPWLRAIAAALTANGHVVVACSALKRAYRDILLGGRSDARLVYLKGSGELVAARLRARKGHFMPPALLDSQFAALEEPGADESPIVVEIGGTPDQIVDEIREKLK